MHLRIEQRASRAGAAWSELEDRSGHPGPGGLIRTALPAIAASFVGSFIAGALGMAGPVGRIGPILGAMLTLFVFRLVNKLTGRSSAIRCGLSPRPFPASAASSGLRRRLQCRRRDRDDALGQQARLVVIVDNQSERAVVSGDEFR